MNIKEHKIHRTDNMNQTCLLLFVWLKRNLDVSTVCYLNKLSELRKHALKAGRVFNW